MIKTYEQLLHKTVELAQLSRSKICLETDDFELKVNLPYFNKERVERIYYNDLPKEDEMVRILEWVGK